MGREAEAERERQEVERRRREEERLIQQRKDAEQAKNKEMLEQMKKQAGQESLNMKIRGKKILDIVADDLKNVDASEIEKAHEAQVQKKRQNKIKIRKDESKRVDH